MGNTGSSSGSEDEAASSITEKNKTSNIVSSEEEIIKVYDSSRRPYLEEIHGKIYLKVTIRTAAKTTILFQFKNTESRRLLARPAMAWRRQRQKVRRIHSNSQFFARPKRRRRR